MTKTVYEIQGFDQEGSKTIGTNTSGWTPDPDKIEDIKTYLKTDYCNWLRPGWQDCDYEGEGRHVSRIMEQEFKDKVNASVKFTVTLKEPRNKSG